MAIEKYRMLINNLTAHNKRQLKSQYVEYLKKNHPQINTIDTYFTDAIFIHNNKRTLKLDLLETLEKDRDFSIYHSRLMDHFLAKGWDCEKAKVQANDYVKKILLFRDFVESWNGLTNHS